MAATSASRSWSTLARRSLAVTATAAVALLALAIPASAHNKKVDAECVGNKTTLTVDLVKYAFTKENPTPNTVKVAEVTGNGETAIASTSFGESFHLKKDDFDPLVGHKFRVEVKAADDPTGEKKFSFTEELTVKACKKDKPPSSSTSTTTTTTTTTTTAAAVPTTTTTTEAPVGANANLAATGASIAIPLGIGGLLLVGGATMLLILRKRRKA